MGAKAVLHAAWVCLAGVTLAALLLAACGTSAGPPVARPPAAPPPGALSHHGQTQTGQPGSFCWHEGCGDMGGIPLPATTLAVPADAVLTFTFSGANPLRTLDAAAYPLTDQSQTRPFAGGHMLYPNSQTATRLPSTVGGRQGTITARLPTGKYVLYVVISGTARRESSASYGFHVVVE